MRWPQWCKKSGYSIARGCCAFWDDFWKHPAEVALIAIAAGGGIWAVVENTNSILTQSRSQLYTNEESIETREFNSNNTKIWSIYARPHTDDPTLYCRELIRAVTPNEYFYDARNAVELNEKIADIDSFDPANATRFQGVQDMRSVAAHLSSILALLHSSYDYWGDGVITRDELETWLGYVRDIGPNPIFLAVIENWRDKRYMSRHFAEMLQIEMFRGPSGKANRDIVDHFYEIMDPVRRPGEFVKGLPNYGNSYENWWSTHIKVP